MNRYFRWLAGVCAAFLLASGSLLALTPQTAFADGRCQPYVVDEANLFGGQTDAVAAAVKSLETVGAEGRAITIRSFGNAGTIDTYVDMMARNCPEWQMSGKLKQNFFAVIMAVQERKMTVYYGTQWKSRFDIEAANIQSGVMRPKFQEEKYAEGFIAAFDKIKQVIKAPAAPSGGSDVPRAPAPAPVPSAPFDWSIVWIVLGGIAVFGLLFLLITMVIVPWLGERRAERELRDEVATLRDKCVAELAALKVAVDKPEFIDWFEDFAVVGGDYQSLAKESRTKAQQYVLDAEAEMKRADTIGDPSLHLDESQYLDLKSAYSSVNKALFAARNELDFIDVSHAEVLKDANAAAEAISGLDDQIAHANTILLGLSQSDIDTSSFGTELEAVSAAVWQYRGLRDASALALIAELPGLTARVSDCKKAIEKARDELATYQDLLASLPALQQAAVDKRVPAGEAFQRMSTQYARSSWENVTGNGSKADKLLFRAKEMFDRATAEPLKNVAQIEERVKTLTEIETMIVRGADLHDAIIARERNIAEAQQSAEQELAAAEADIAAAESYIHQFPEDVDQKLDRSLDEARKYLANARQELSKEKPNYLVVVKQALLANGAADKVFAVAVEQHEYLESVRRQLETARSLFATSSDKSSRYISSHSADVGPDAQRLLDKARAKFARVDDQPDEVSQLKVAKEALELANSAYDTASGDVAAAEAERAAARRERERRDREEREARERRDREERERQQSYYHSSTSYSSYSSSSSSSYDSSSSFSSGGSDFGGSSGSSGW